MKNKNILLLLVFPFLLNGSNNENQDVKVKKRISKMFVINDIELDSLTFLSTAIDEYDLNGNIVKSYADEIGIEMRYDYLFDSVGNPIKISTFLDNELSSISKIKYDSNNNQIAVLVYNEKNTLIDSTFNEYDIENNLITVTKYYGDSIFMKMGFFYNEINLLIEDQTYLEESKEPLISSYYYDSNNNLETIVGKEGFAGHITSTTTFKYNSHNLPSMIIIFEETLTDKLTIFEYEYYDSSKN